MALLQESRVRQVLGVSEEQVALICAFLQGAVYCWCKNRKDEWFSMRDLMGGDNFHWEGTPLIALYEKQLAAGVAPADAVERAGQEGGWLLKRVIAADRRNFHTKKEELIRKYRWEPDA